MDFNFLWCNQTFVEEEKKLLVFHLEDIMHVIFLYYMCSMWLLLKVLLPDVFVFRADVQTVSFLCL